MKKYTIYMLLLLCSVVVSFANERGRHRNVPIPGCIREVELNRPVEETASTSSVSPTPLSFYLDAI